MGRDRQELVDAVGVAMQRYQRSVQGFDDAAGKHLGLGPADLRCLDWLADGPKTAGQLSAATALSPAAVTAMVDRLSRKGFVERVRHEGDRRQVLVQMTEEGRARTWDLWGPMVVEGQQLLAGLSADDLSLMRAHLDVIRELTDRHRDDLVLRTSVVRRDPADPA